MYFKFRSVKVTLICSASLPQKKIVCVIPRPYVFVYFGALVLHGVWLFCRVLPALRVVLRFQADLLGTDRWLPGETESRRESEGMKEGGSEHVISHVREEKKAWHSSRRRDWRGAVSAESMRRRSGGCLRNWPAVSEPTSRGSSCSRSHSLARSLPSFSTCLSQSLFS